MTLFENERNGKYMTDRHVDLFVNGVCANKNWINLALSLNAFACKHIKSKCYNCHVMISFSLNVIKNKGVIPKRLSNRLINKSNTPPVLFLCKDTPQNYLFPESKLVNHLRSQYNMTVYYYEEYEDVVYRYLFYVPDKPEELVENLETVGNFGGNPG